MIYLISGSPRSGKSKLAKMFAEKTGFQHFSVDDLRPVVEAYLPKDTLQEKIPSELMYKGCDYDNDAYFAKYSAQEMIAADLVDSKTMFLGAESLINHFYLTQRDLVLEGVQLLPQLVEKLKNNKYWPQIRIVYLVKTDITKIREGFEKNNPKSDWLLQNTKNPETLDKAAAMIGEYGKYFESEAEKYNFKVFNTENDFLGTLNEVSKYLA